MSDKLVFPVIDIKPDGLGFKLETTTAYGLTRAVKLDEPSVRDTLGFVIQVFNAWKRDRECEYSVLMDRLSIGGGKPKWWGIR